MKKENGLTAGVSEPEKVAEFMNNLQHQLADAVSYLRNLILNVDTQIGEGIYWNTPTFYFTGPMKPFDPKLYKRYIVNFNLFKQDAVRLVFLRGATVSDPAGLLEGDFKDGRRLGVFKDLADVKSKEAALNAILKELIITIDN
jgi:hypothetical protein